jgi:hypothetical protein
MTALFIALASLIWHYIRMVLHEIAYDLLAFGNQLEVDCHLGVVAANNYRYGENVISVRQQNES